MFIAKTKKKFIYITDTTRCGVYTNSRKRKKKKSMKKKTLKIELNNLSFTIDDNPQSSSSIYYCRNRNLGEKKLLLYTHSK